MNPWVVTTWLLATCLVSAFFGWVAASIRYSNLAWHVAEMESAVEHYWDRIRKRTRVEPYVQPRVQTPEQEAQSAAGIEFFEASHANVR